MTTAALLGRRDVQKEQTRLDLAVAAFELAAAGGLANVRVPEIAAAVGVSPRTFNNYFHSKEAAIVWPVTLRADRLAQALAERPPGEPLGRALAATVAGMYQAGEIAGLPADWPESFRALVAREPGLHGEYLKASGVVEERLSEAIATRMALSADRLEPRVLAAVVVGAERAGVLHWVRAAQPPGPLVEVVRCAVEMGVRGMEGLS